MAVLACKVSYEPFNRYYCVRKCLFGPTRVENLKEGTQIFDNVLTIVHESNKVYFVKVIDIASCSAKEQKFDLSSEEAP